MPLYCLWAKLRPSPSWSAQCLHPRWGMAPVPIHRGSELMSATQVLIGHWLHMKEVAQVLYRAALAWNRDNVMRLSAAVAMYTILSLSPLLVITIKVLGVVL